ncbi:MAG: hypothetical protein GY778_10345 [bacterium]|nr:hypothetical protein [bacterium]
MTASQGLELGEHGQTLWAQNLGRASIEVPLIIKLPRSLRGSLAIPEGARISQPRIWATLVESAGERPEPVRAPSLFRSGEAPIVSELYLRNGVNEFSLLDGDLQLIWSTRFAPAEPEFYLAQLALRGGRPPLTEPARRILDRLEVAFLQTPPFSGPAGGAAPRLRLERWTASGTVPVDDPARALGPPQGGGTASPGNSSLVSLGGFGGSITLAFDHTVFDDPANPFGLDAIVFGNAQWVGGDPNRPWGEGGTIEISRDVNSNGLADDAWYLIPGSHLPDPVGQFEVQTWDDDFGDPTYPPGNPAWLPAGQSGVWATQGYRLPTEVFDTLVLENPNGPSATTEGIYGYADHTPTLILGDLDGDNLVDDAAMEPATFYTAPDDPYVVGITPGSGGGDAFDIAWAIDPVTAQPAGLTGLDFVRITNGVNYLAGVFGEVSPEIDAVADVRPELMGDADADGDLDLDDWSVLYGCLTGPDVVPPAGCSVFLWDGDSDVDLVDVAGFQAAFTGG